MTKRIFTGLSMSLLIAAPIALTTSCGSETNRSGTFNVSDGTLDVGLELAYAPYNFTITAAQYSTISAQAATDTDLNADDNMTPAQADAFMEMIAPADSGTHGGGIDVYVAKRIATSLSTPTQTITAKLHTYDWDALIPSMTIKGEFDAIIAGMTSTAERREVISFTNSYLDAENVVLRKSSTAVPTFDTLRNSNKKIGVQSGTVQHDIAEAQFGANRVATYDDANLVEEAIKGGVIDYAICEDVRAAVAVAIHSELAYTEGITQIYFGTNSAGNNIGVPKTISTEMMAKLNAGITAISATDRAKMVETAGALAVYVGQA